MERQEANVALPTPDEVKRIKPLIAKELAAAGVTEVWFDEPLAGGLKATAQIPAEKQRNLQDALFAHGIVIVATGAGEWGFAVRR